MVKIIENPEVGRPTPDPLRSSILDHASVVENVERFGLRNNEGMWPSYNALTTLNLVSTCPQPFEGFKTFDTAEWVTAFEFALYRGVQCLAVGLDKDDQKSEARRVFEASEGKSVEALLRETRFAPVDSSEDITWDDPTVLTVPDGTPLAYAVGLLEGHAAKVYAGVPTLHMPRAAVVVLMGAGVVVERDGLFYTKTGAKVAAGGGYDEDIETGDWTLYATGEVYVETSDIIHEQQMVLPGDGSGLGSDENGLSDNTVITLVERAYRVAVDGFVASVTVSVW